MTLLLLPTMPALPCRRAYVRVAVATRAALSLAALSLALPSTLHAQTSAPRAGTRVFGVVFDSLAMRPLPRATVQFVAADDPTNVRTVTADDKGAFAFNQVDPGSYLLGFFHPRLDSLSLNSPLLRVDVRQPGALQASIGIPSGSTIVARFCGVSAARDSIGLFQGRVRNASGEPITSPAKVRVQWGELVLGTRGVERRTPSVLANTSSDGAFAICGVPAGTMMMTRAWSGTDTSGYVELQLPYSGYLSRDILVSRAQLVTPNDSFPMLRVSRGNATLRGTVRNMRGQPVVGARVAVWSTGVEVATNANGQFSMESLPGGTYTLEARALGFQVQRIPVDIGGATSAAEVTLEPMPVLDTVRVRAARATPSAGLAEFETRRKAGNGGYFLDESAIENRRAVAISDLFRMAPGVSVSAGQAFGDKVLMRGTGSYCVPALFLNGNRIFNEDGNLDAIADPREVRGIEVYARGVSIPTQFQSQSGCGVIVLWVGTPK